MKGLLHFVQNHRRITKRMVARAGCRAGAPRFRAVAAPFGGRAGGPQHRADDQVVPETLEVSADIELLDQALINLLRNAMEALRDGQPGKIALTAALEPAAVW